MHLGVSMLPSPGITKAASNKTFFSGISPFHAIILLFIFPYITLPSFAQVCAIQGPQVPNSGGQLECLQISDINGDTLRLPRNVTRLESNGISICPLQSVSNSPPAVMFIVDQSASMSPIHDPSGDPYQYRATMIRKAIQYLNNRVSNGWFGYIEFAGNIDVIRPSNEFCRAGENDNTTTFVSQSLIPLSDANVALWSSRMGPIQNRCSPGTNYIAPLERAKQFFNNFRASDQVADFTVIFISDGLPNEPDDSWATASAPLDPDFRVPGPFPPIHGIFLGESGQDGAIMARLSSETGGTYNLISPSDTGAMSRVMNGIIESIVRRSAPQSVQLRVGGSTYNSTQLEQESLGGGYRVHFPQTIPLDTGFNTMELLTTFSDTAGDRRTQTTSFFLDISAPDAQIGVHGTDGYFEVACSEQRGITVGGIRNPQLLPNANLELTPRLDANALTELQLGLLARNLLDSVALVSVWTARSGDRMDVRLSLGDSPGDFLGSTPIEVLERNMDGTPRQARVTDNILQVAGHDTLFLRWVHPQDPRDTLSASILLYTLAQASFTNDTLYIDHIASRVMDVAAGGNSVTVRYFWSDGTPVSQAELLRVGGGDFYTGIADLRQRLAEERSPRLVLQYYDALYGNMFTDTAHLIFELPVMPRVRMVDLNGDGRADRLELLFAESIPPQQDVEDYILVWGNRDQDTVRLRLPLDDLPFLENVQVQQLEGNSQRWNVDLPEPLPFGNTSGSGPMGQGQLLVTGTFNDRPLNRNIPVIDAVGPVILQFWVDPREGLVNYMRLSEVLAEQAGQNWLLVNGARGPATERTVSQWEYNEGTQVITLRMVDLPENVISGGDSIRLVPEAMGGVRDRAANGAHPENPPVVAQGFREPRSAIVMRYRESLLQPQTNNTPYPIDNMVPTQYRILLATNTAGVLRDSISGTEVSDTDLRGIPLLEIGVTVPLLNGLDADGNVRQGPLVNGLLAWSSEITVVTYAFDNLGQFIVRKSARLVVNEPAQLSPEGRAVFFLLWPPDAEKGLVDRFGRSVGNGPLMIKTFVTMVSTALIDVEIFEADGSLSDRSVSEGKTIVDKSESLSILGYLRPPR